MSYLKNYSNFLTKFWFKLKTNIKTALESISPFWVRWTVNFDSDHLGKAKQWSQNVGAGGHEHAPMWEDTQSSAPCRCVPTSSLRFHAFGCWTKTENYVSVDFVSKWREADDKFKITKHIIQDTTFLSLIFLKAFT